jgi:hypothetical protein
MRSEIPIDESETVEEFPKRGGRIRYIDKPNAMLQANPRPRPRYEPEI